MSAPNDGEIDAMFDRQVGTALRRQATWAEPPDNVEDQVIAAIGRVAPQLRRRSTTSRWARPVAAAILALALAAGAVAIAFRGDARTEIALQATDLAPTAEGELRLRDTSSGLDIELEVEGLRPAEADEYYQGWVRTVAGDIITIGTFHLRDDADPVRLWAGVDLDQLMGLTVTLQKLGDGPASSGAVVLKADLSEATDP